MAQVKSFRYPFNKNGYDYTSIEDAVFKILNHLMIYKSDVARRIISKRDNDISSAEYDLMPIRNTSGWKLRIDTTIIYGSYAIDINVSHPKGLTLLDAYISPWTIYDGLGEPPEYEYPSLYGRVVQKGKTIALQIFRKINYVGVEDSSVATFSDPYCVVISKARDKRYGFLSTAMYSPVTNDISAVTLSPAIKNNEAENRLLTISPMVDYNFIPFDSSSEKSFTIFDDIYRMPEFYQYQDFSFKNDKKKTGDNFYTGKWRSIGGHVFWSTGIRDLYLRMS